MKVYRTRVAGHLAFAESVGRPRTEVTQDVGDRPERIFDGPVRHVALMRPSELVVRYVEFPGMREESDWAGVFLSSEDESALRAFASFEPPAHDDRSEEHTSELQSLMRISYAVFCLKKKKKQN